MLSVSCSRSTRWSRGHATVFWPGTRIAGTDKGMNQTLPLPCLRGFQLFSYAVIV